MTFYLTGAIIVCGILLHAFLRDTSTPKTHLGSWVVLIVGTILWPIVLPSIIRKRLHKERPLDLDLSELKS